MQFFPCVEIEFYKVLHRSICKHQFLCLKTCHENGTEKAQFVRHICFKDSTNKVLSKYSFIGRVISLITT